MATSLPEKKISKIKVDASNTYTIVPEILQNNGFQASLPTLTADSTIALTTQIPATNVIPATTTANKLLVSTATSGTAKWSDWSTSGYLKTNASGVVTVDSSITANNADKVDDLHMLDQTYAYLGYLDISIGCVNAVVNTGLTEAQIFALTGNRYGQLYLASDTNKYWRRKNTQTTASADNWRNDTAAATTSLALPNQLTTTEDAVYIRLNVNQKYYSKLPKFFVEAGYDNVSGSTQITGFCRKQNDFEITSCNYNGNNLIGIYQETANTDQYIFKFTKFRSNYGATSQLTITPRIYYNEASGTPTVTFIGSTHADYNKVKAYSYCSVPDFGIKGTAIYDTMLPRVSGSLNLGSASYKWNTAYLNNINDGSSSIATSNIITTVKVNGTIVSSGHAVDITVPTIPASLVNTVNSKKGAVTVGLTSSTTTSTDAVKYLEDISYTSASSSGSETVSKSNHTHKVTATGSVSLGSNTTSTGGVAYVESTGANSTKYMHWSAGTTPASSASFTGSSVTSSGNSGTKVDAVIGYPNFSGGSGSMTATVKYMTVSTTTDTVNTGVNSGSTVNAYTGVSTAGKIVGTRSTAGSGSTARRVLTITHTDPAFSTTGVAPASHTHSVTVITGASLVENTSSVTDSLKYVKEVSHSHTGASLGTPSTSPVAPNGHTHSVTASGSVSLTSGTAPALTFNTVSTGGEAYVTGVTSTTKYFHPSFTGSETTSGDGSGSTATAITGISAGTVTKTIRYVNINTQGDN